MRLKKGADRFGNYVKLSWLRIYWQKCGLGWQPGQQIPVIWVRRKVTPFKLDFTWLSQANSRWSPHLSLSICTTLGDCRENWWVTQVKSWQLQLRMVVVTSSRILISFLQLNLKTSAGTSQGLEGREARALGAEGELIHRHSWGTDSFWRTTRAGFIKSRTSQRMSNSGAVLESPLWLFLFFLSRQRGVIWSVLYNDRHGQVVGLGKNRLKDWWWHWKLGNQEVVD